MKMNNTFLLISFNGVTFSSIVLFYVIIFMIT